MKIKVKNSELTKNTIEAINNLMEMDINASCAFKLMKIVKDLSETIETKNSAEKKLIDRYAEKDESGNYVVPVDQNGNSIEDSLTIKNIDEFTKEMKDLMDVENELLYDKLNIDDLGLKTAKIKDLISLEFLFDFN
jgi:hypothetical protein